MDIAVAALGLLLLSPLLLLVAVAVRLDSPGPVLYRQVRLGKGAEPFTFYKFRTMVANNDPGIHQRYVSRLITRPSEELKGDTGAFKIENDPRVTRLGRFLRRASIDELPQLYNVLRGDMSLVGPRPPIPYEVELYSPRALRRLECKPGITGLWQVSGRCMKTYDEMVELDIEYIDNWSLRMDLVILARTPAAVLGKRGAW
jgi:lipopolysaccharide/colanic/teichoic acid biosynthesis glycosyltransferase